jgi:hypothetical protein
MWRQNKPLKKTRIKLHITLALPALLYNSDNWTIKTRDAKRIAVAETKYMRKTAGYNWKNYKTNKKVAKELNMIPVLDKIQKYRRNWLRQINRIPRNRLPTIVRKNQ